MNTNVFIFKRINDQFILDGRIIGGINFPPNPNDVGDIESVTKKMEEIGFSRVTSQVIGNETLITYQKPETDLDRLEIALSLFDWKFKSQKDKSLKDKGVEQEKVILDLVKKTGAEGKKKYEEAREKAQIE